MLYRFVITDLRVCMSSSFSIISSPYMVDRKGMRRTFRRSFFHGIEIYLLSVSMLLANRSSQRCFFPGSISTAASYGSSFYLCSASCACITVRAFFFAGFLRVTPSRLAVHSTLLTSVNYNIVFPVVRYLRSCCPYFIMCYLHGEFDSSVCYIFPSLAMGSFKLTMIPRSDTSSCFRVLLSWQSDIGLLSSTNSGWTICRPLPRGWFNTELG